MDITARSTKQDEILQETATRLIDALGVESAIYVCRSNYWHGVLRLVQAQEHEARMQPTRRGKPQSVHHDRLHSLPQIRASRRLPAEDMSRLPLAA